MRHRSGSTIASRIGTLLTAAALATVGVAVAATPAQAVGGTKAYVANAGSGTVSVIDTATSTVTTSIGVGAVPIGVAAAPDGQTVYVTNGDDSGPAGFAAAGNSVSVIDTATDTVTATVGVGREPEGIAVDPSGARVYTANRYSNSVSVIDTASLTVTATIGVGSGPVDVAVSRPGRPCTSPTSTGTPCR